MEPGDYINYVFVIYYSNGVIRFRTFRSHTGTISYLKARININEKFIDAIKNDCSRRKINIDDKDIDVNFKIGDLYVVILPEDYPQLSKLVYYDVGYDMNPMDNFKHIKLSEEMLYYVNSIVPQLHNYFIENHPATLRDYIAYLNYTHYANQVPVNKFAYPPYNMYPMYPRY